MLEQKHSAAFEFLKTRTFPKILFSLKMPYLLMYMDSDDFCAQANGFFISDKNIWRFDSMSKTKLPNAKLPKVRL
jgi:hypothetical protein